MKAKGSEGNMSRKIVSIHTAAEGMETAIEEITPQMAMLWLSKNAEENRNVRETVVRRYAGEMVEGRWAVTHQGIAFDREGKLVDGQHRLRAVMLAAVPVRMLVFRNVPVGCSGPIDQGASRSPGDLLGKKNTYVAMIRGLLWCEAGTFSKEIDAAGAIRSCMEANQETLDTCWERIGVTRRYVTGPVLGALAFAYPVDPARVLAFGKQIASGEMLGRGEPAFTFRGWMDRRVGRQHPSEMVLATLNAARYALMKLPVTSVYTTESGYRAFATKRRTMGIPRTPHAGQVASMNFPPSKNET